MEAITITIVQLMNLLGAFFAALLQGSRNSNNHSGGGIGGEQSKGGEKNNNDDHIDHSDDPFEVLGLKGGKADTTIDEAKKAMRKLALKWHPDRNADNVEEATLKMQKINHAFEEVERILEGGGEAQPCQDENKTSSDSNEDVQESGDDESVKSESEGAKRRARQKRKRDQRNARRKRERKQRKWEEQQYEAAQVATGEVREEFTNFQRAQRKAAQGIFESATFTAPSASTTTSSLRKNVGRRGKKAAARVRRRQEMEDKSKCSNEKGTKTADDENSVPFHRLPVEKRCVAKFGSKTLVTMPTFTAIRTRAYNVLHVFTSQRDPCDGIELPAEAEGGGDAKIFVTPLMVASYLGDYDAVDVILENAGKEWWKVVLAESLPKGDDSLALAKEALEIAEKAHAESQEYQAKAETQDELDDQIKIVAEHAERLEMAEKLVDHLEGMKKLALKKKRQNTIISWVMKGVRSLAAFYFLGFICAFISFYLLGFIWAFLALLVGLFSMPFRSSEHKEEPSLSKAINSTTFCETNNDDNIDDCDEPFFCDDGEACSEGDTCTDTKLKATLGTMEVYTYTLECKCGKDLKFVCTEHVSTVFGSTRIPTSPYAYTYTPANEYAIAESTAAESISVGVCLVAIIVGLLRAFCGLTNKKRWL